VPKLLRNILDREGRDFYRIDRRWQPRSLLPEPYTRNMLKEAQQRYDQLSKAESELKVLVRGDRYIKILRRMQLTLRKAAFAWRADDLKFISAVSEFFMDYGTVLQMLKIDEARGRLDEPEPEQE
jgi:hypothetical protein